jgi:hypothetical protein
MTKSVQIPKSNLDLKRISKIHKKEIKKNQAVSCIAIMQVQRDAEGGLCLIRNSMISAVAWVSIEVNLD